MYEQRMNSFKLFRKRRTSELPAEVFTQVLLCHVYIVLLLFIDVIWFNVKIHVRCIGFLLSAMHYGLNGFLLVAGWGGERQDRACRTCRYMFRTHGSEIVGVSITHTHMRWLTEQWCYLLFYVNLSFMLSVWFAGNETFQLLSFIVKDDRVFSKHWDQIEMFWINLS